MTKFPFASLSIYNLYDSLHLLVYVTIGIITLFHLQNRTQGSQIADRVIHISFRILNSSSCQFRYERIVPDFAHSSSVPFIVQHCLQDFDIQATL